MTLAIVNLMPIVPGHVLVIPKKPLARLADLSVEEVTDLFKSVQIVGKAVEKAYKAEALTIAIQDGKMAGQTIPHLHVHILPRHASDFEPMDQVYEKLDGINISKDFKNTEENKTVNEERPGKEEEDEKERVPKKIAMDYASAAKIKPRTREDMTKEADWLKTFFSSTTSSSSSSTASPSLSSL